LTTEIILELKNIFGNENISEDLKILEQYASDTSIEFYKGKKPVCVVWPRNIKDVQSLIKIANKYSFGLVPTSSSNPRLHGTSVPKVDNAIIVDFTKMNKILSIDKKNRVVMLESGVNFRDYIKAAREEGLRPDLPLYPYEKKSVVGAALDREPIIIPKYHWDISDPLLCTELVFGTGNMFRTGAAAGPGNLTEQREAGGAQKNPMGPAQFSPFRIIQGAQGTIGLVTWATLKVQRAIDARKTFYVTSDNLETNLDFIYELLKYRLGDELFILNNLNLAVLIKDNQKDIEKLRNNLDNWIGIISITGSGELANEKLEWQEGDIKEYAKKFGVNLKSNIPNISNNDVRKILEEASPNPWRLKYLGGCNDIFFITTLDKTPKYVKITWNKAKEIQFSTTNIGVYIQPMVQGCNVHCEFDLYFDPNNDEELNIAQEMFKKCSQDLIDNGAFFSRPYGIWADMVYSKIQPEIIGAMKKVKNIFDPKNILNPGALCFKEV